MKLLPPPLVKTSFRDFLNSFCTIIPSGFAMIWTFYLAFILPLKYGFPLFTVIIIYCGCFIGAIFALVIVNKWNHYLGLLIFGSSYILVYTIQIIIDKPWFVSLALFIAGISVGSFFGIIFRHQVLLSSDLKSAGRLLSLGFIGFFVMLIVTVIFSPNSVLLMSFFLLFFVLFLFSTLAAKSGPEIPHQTPFNFRRYIQQAESRSALVVALLIGFFLTAPYYIALIILEGNGLLNDLTNFNDFLIVFSIAIIVFSYPSGVLFDFLGRRRTMLIGFCIQAMAFVLLAFDQSEFILLVIFPFICGIGFTMTIIGMYLLLGELPPIEHIRDYNSLNFAALALGMIISPILGEILRDLILGENGPLYLSVIFLFIFLLVTQIVSQVKETLPSKEDLISREKEIRKYVQRASTLMETLTEDS